MDIIVQWATILSPIVAVALAIWANRCSAKDTAKNIAALEKSTTKQVESIKHLAKLQLATTQIQINKELWEARMRRLQALGKKGDQSEYDHRFNHIGGAEDFFRRKHEKESELSYEEDFQAKYAEVLEKYQTRLKEMAIELGGV